MLSTKSLLFAIVTRLDYSSDVYDFALIGSIDWVIPAVATFCVGVVIAFKSRK